MQLISFIVEYSCVFLLDLLVEHKENRKGATVVAKDYKQGTCLVKGKLSYMGNKRTLAAILQKNRSAFIVKQ